MVGERSYNLVPRCLGIDIDCAAIRVPDFLSMDVQAFLGEETTDGESNCPHCDISLGVFVVLVERRLSPKPGCGTIA